MDSKSLLEKITQRIGSELQLQPVMAAEIEFYLHGISTLSAPDRNKLLQEIHDASRDKRIDALKVEKERGAEQYEVALTPHPNPLRVADGMIRLKRSVSDICRRWGVEADFSAKPFDDQPGSGLHIHLHLEDVSGRNLFFKQDEQYSAPLLYAIGGILSITKEAMIIFAPARESYRRFIPGTNAPVTISWGANNRTVAVRLPTKPLDHKHLEHRIAGADADPALVMAVVLAGAHYGMSQHIGPGEQIFGDAALPIYALESLPKDFKTAVDLAQHARVLPEYVDDALMRYVQECLNG